MTLPTEIKRLVEAHDKFTDRYAWQAGDFMRKHGEQLLRCLEALEPFSKVAQLSSHPRLDPENIIIWQRTSTIPGDEFSITLADCQRARDALQNTGEKA